LLLLTPDFGKVETLWAALLVAVSPAMVFYSRYYIHEMLLVFFIALAKMCWWRYTQNRNLGWCAAAGLGFGLMAATKETFVLSVLAMALALFCVGNRRWNWKALAVIFSVGVVVAILFFSSFFANPGGILDAIRAFAPWLHRAGGATVHNHPWNFYFERLFFYRANGGPLWSEGLIGLLAVVGFVASKSRLNLIIAYYTFWLLLFYTVAPYKTPWCLLDFYYPMILMAGVGAAELTRRFKFQAIVVLLLGAAQLGWQAWGQNFAVDKGGVPFCDTAKIPYTYSQTTPDLYRLLQTVDGLARVSPAGNGTVMEVMSPDSYWPLPWYLRRYTAVGYWDKIPAQPPAPIMIVSTALRANFDEGPKKTHLMAGYFELRPKVFFELYVDVDLWAQYVKTLPPEKD
jgi:uncharacterized protein (TIGR03663 family)